MGLELADPRLTIFAASLFCYAFSVASDPFPHNKTKGKWAGLLSGVFERKNMNFPFNLG